MNTEHMTNDWVDAGLYCAQDVINLRDYVADLRARLQTAETRLKESEEWNHELQAVHWHTLQTADGIAFPKRAVDTLEKIYKNKLQTAEQQLGQVGEEVERLRSALSFYAAEGVYTRDGWSGRLEPVMDDSGDKAREALSATPSDGCGKGRTEAGPRCDTHSRLMQFFGYIGPVGQDGSAGEDWRCPECDASKNIYCKITRSDGSVHMLPDPVKVGDVEWQLRYGKPESVRWEAASVLAFYRTFFSLPYKSRLEVMTKLLAASSSGEEGGR